MLTHLTVQLNNAAQDRILLDQAVCWFTALPAAQQHQALQHLAMFIQQAGAPRRRDIAKVQQALRHHTDSLAVTGNNVHLALNTLIDTDASVGTFTLMLAIFAAQDRKRRDTRCAAGCVHWWHHLHQHPAMAGPAADVHQATVHESRHDRRALVYHGTWPATGPSTGQWLVRVEIPSLHERPQAGTWFGGRTLYTHAQPSQADAVSLAQQWLDDGVYPSGPEDHLDHHEPQFRTGQLVSISDSASGAMPAATTAHTTDATSTRPSRSCTPNAAASLSAAATSTTTCPSTFAPARS